jgi:hypothetical protein
MDFFTFVDVSPASTRFQDAGKSDGIWGDALYLHLHEAMESLMAIRLGSRITSNEGIPREHVSDGKVVVQLLCFGKETTFRIHANEGAGASHGAFVADLTVSSPMVNSSLPACCSTISLSIILLLPLQHACPTNQSFLSAALTLRHGTLPNPKHPAKPCPTQLLLK